MDLTAQIDFPAPLLRLKGISGDAAEIVIRDTERLLLRRVKSGTPRGVTGDLWAGWEVISDRYGFTLYNPIPYASYVEVGGPHLVKGDNRSNWPHVGPRTVQSGDTIWSRQAEGGLVGPIVDDTEWLNRAVTRIVELVEQELTRG